MSPSSADTISCLASRGPEISVTTHDDCPPEETAIVDAGLDAYNNAAAPLHEVTPLSCFARLPSGVVIGGAVGRTWGR